MLDKYLFILGREPHLSVAEIMARAEQEKIKLNWLSISSVYALVEGEIDLDFFRQLAGSVKLAKVLAEVDYKQNAVKEFIYKQLVGVSSECLFGFSWYGRRAPFWLRRVGIELKRRKARQGRARFVESRSAVLSSVIVQKNRLLPSLGREFIFMPLSETKLLIGQSLAVQEFADWAERDYGRPERNARVGMLPPKLARLMINLSKGEFTEPLLDPFCGSGTVLQEAAVLGYKILWGSDIDGNGIKRTKVNLHWLKQKHSNLSFTENLLAADIRQLQERLKDIKFGAIVTEPYLGPVYKIPNTDQYYQIEKELLTLYRTALKVLAGLILPARRLVMVWPVFHIGSKSMYLPLVEELPSLGWKEENILPDLSPLSWLNKRGSMVYGRFGQRVGREIFVLRRI